MPVLRFNGSKYDINLMKHYLHKSLEDCGEIVSFAIKKAMLICHSKLNIYNFLDVRRYLAARTYGSAACESRLAAHADCGAAYGSRLATRADGGAAYESRQA